jgi:hypothetical protein
MTKKRAEAREGLLKFLKILHWSVAFDPSFTAAKRNRKLGQTAIKKMDDAIRGLHFQALQSQDYLNAELLYQLLNSLESHGEELLTEDEFLFSFPHADNGT